MPQASTPIRVPFPDVDSSGRIHFTAMLRYMEVAEHELMRSLGFPYAVMLQSMALPRVHVSCDYRAAVGYDDLLTIDARVEHVGRSSWTVAFTAHALEQAGRTTEVESDIVAEGRMTIVVVDPQTGRAQPLPDVLRAALQGV